MRYLKYYISNTRATMFPPPLSGLSKVCGFSQGQVGASADVVAGCWLAFASLDLRENSNVAVSNIATKILDAFTLFMFFVLMAMRA